MVDGYRPSSSGALRRRDLGRVGVDRGTDVGALRTGVRPAVVGLRGVENQSATGEVDAGDHVAAQIHHLVERHGVDQGRHGGDRIAVVAVLADGVEHADGRDATDLIAVHERDDDEGRRHAGVGSDRVGVRQICAEAVVHIAASGTRNTSAFIGCRNERGPTHCHGGEGQEEQARESLHRIISIATEAGTASVTY